MNGRNYLFMSYDWHSVDRNQREQLQKEVITLDGDRLLNTSPDDLAAYLEEKYKINVPILRRADIEVDQRESQMDVSGDPMRFIRDRTRPFYIPSTLIEVVVPYDGDKEAFGIRPTTYTMNPPCAEIRDGGLVIHIEGTNLSSDQVKAEIERRLREIEEHLVTMRRDAAALNGQLRAVAAQAIETRRKKLLSDRNLVAGLGFKMKERFGAVRTYVAQTSDAK
jgi:hypothetical protein